MRGDLRGESGDACVRGRRGVREGVKGDTFVDFIGDENEVVRDAESADGMEFS